MKLTNAFFTVSTRTRSQQAALSFRVHGDQHTTQHFPHIIPFLMRQVPDVLETRCFNPGHLPFHEEVLNTEMGHLFEHILITFLCQEADKAGWSGVCYDASTAWDWYKYPPGSFSITIFGAVPTDHLLTATKRTVEVMQQLFLTQKQQPLTWLPPAQSRERELESRLPLTHL